MPNMKDPEIQSQIDTIKNATKKAMASKEKATKFLTDGGILKTTQKKESILEYSDNKVIHPTGHLLTILLTHDSALKALQVLERKQFIKIIKSTVDITSPSHKGKSIDLPTFEAWISKAQNGPTVSLKDARSKWAAEKAKIQQAAK